MEVTENLQRNLIAGQWVDAVSGESFPNVNPANPLDVIGCFAQSGATEVGQAVDAAYDARATWRGVGPIERAQVVRSAARLIMDRESDFAIAISSEQGKLLREAISEVRRTCSILEFVAGEGRRFNGYTTPADDPGTLAMVYRVPVGVVGLITPWNFPLAIPAWKIGPALVAGCTMILKPSPLAPLTAAMLAQVFTEVGLPPGVLNLVQGGVAAGAALVADPRVAGISFTGLVSTGRAILQAGAHRLLRTQLELGGKNGVLVLRDADLEAAADAIVTGAFSQAGQRCSATSRAIVERPVADTLLDLIAERVSALRVGSPFDPRSDLGPLVSDDHMNACLSAIDVACAGGAKIATGKTGSSPAGSSPAGSSPAGSSPAGHLPEGGYYVRPTVLYDVPWDSELARREIFGPVLAVIECADFDDGVRISNSVEYGMSATVFSRDLGRVFEAIDRFDAGMIHGNRPGIGAYAHLPHVGAKQSQFGPPECSPQAFDFYCEWRSACVNLTTRGWPGPGSRADGQQAADDRQPQAPAARPQA